MGAFDWLFGKQEVAGQAQMAFDHPKVYGDVETGPGVAVASQTAADWQEKVSAAFADADAALDRVLKDSEIMMQGAAGDQSRDAVTPLSQATRGSIEVAAQAGAAVQQQAQGSADFKNAFPAPHQVPPDNIGWGDYVNPISYGYKSGVRAAHEEKHDQVEAQARQQYESYTQATNDRVNGIQQFAPPPTFAGDVTPAQTTPVNKVSPMSTGYTGTGDMSSAQSSTARTPGSPIPSASMPPGGQSSVDPAPQVPAESGSAWATPPAAAGPLPGPAAPTPAPGGGFVGGAVIPPGGTGTGTGTGGRIGTGTGRGLGAGTPRGGGGNLGSGGRTGGLTPGSSAASGTSGTTARGGAAGGVTGATGAQGRGQGSDDDKEHTNKYAEHNTDPFTDLGLPNTAPPVFGDWTAQTEDGKPPRPPEEK
ncbi:hypothetical protein [Saccharopolyspora spinosa]|uniref:PPE family protein n=1 Tax=Saccharopolyspora spinosa TaxID=60894 RepID=A0A2N3XZ00_SACSN|nr:hypothetical protein [Saccharopolyspora spinosa]PKW15904.1 hypothetical protein A8926_3686 [Saccharopolyspora spinosa]